MTQTEQFFHDRLAEAEEYAQQHGLEYEWEDDPNGCIGCDCGSESCECYSGESHENTVLCTPRL